MILTPFNSFRPPPCLQSLRKVGQDSTVLLICITVFLSYLPEAGQYSSFFLYLRQVSLLRQGKALVVGNPSLQM